MKLTSAERIERSQLIPGVSRSHGAQRRLGLKELTVCHGACAVMSLARRRQSASRASGQAGRASSRERASSSQRTPLVHSVLEAGQRASSRHQVMALRLQMAGQAPRQPANWSSHISATPANNAMKLTKGGWW
jgi:hypothetical protein